MRAPPPPGAPAPRRGLPVHELTSPPPLAAVALLALNDHVFKAAWPGPVTGKLSDLAGLFYFPLLLTAAARLAVGAARTLTGAPPGARVPPLRRWHLTAAVALTGLAFTAINLDPRAMAAWDAALSLVTPSRGTTDPTDLIALAMLPLSWLWGRRFVDADPPDGP